MIAPRVRASLAYFALFGGLGGLLPYASLYYLDRGLDYPQIGALLSSSALVGLVAGPAWGALSDRLGGSPIVVLATGALAVAGVAALPLVADFEAILLANFAIGAGTAGLMPILDARALESSGDRRAGWGRLRAWGSAGWVASSFLTGVAVEAWGLAIVFVVATTGFALAAVLAFGLVPATVDSADRPLRATLQLFATRTLGLFLVGALLANSAMSAVLTFFTPRFDELGASTALIGLSWALPAAIEVPVMAGFPSMARRVGGTRLLVVGAIFLVMRSSLAAAATTPEVLVIASTIGGIGYGLFTVGAVTYVAQRVPPHLAATGQGVFQGVALGLSGVVAAAAGGVVAGSIGISGMFALAAGVGLLGAAVVALAVLSRRAAPIRLQGPRE